MSYPDLVVEEGRTYLTETQKDKARVHEVDRALLEGLWDQFENAELATQGLVMDWRGAMPGQVAIPELPAFCTRDGGRADYGTKDMRQGFTIDAWLRLDELKAGQVVLDSRTESGQGLCLQISGRGSLQIVLNDGRTENRWDCDTGLLSAGGRHHVAVVVDGGPKVITFVVDGRLCDGGTWRQFGWGRFSPNLRHANGTERLRIGPSLRGRVEALRIYDRYLRTSEVMGNWRAGRIVETRRGTGEENT